ncbi:LuxR C-terminal-related transcriptional regulator [Haematomicrobium sanguinis]|uniref:LuxR C-terminal-related transcriptional regulator n=1 Tax=Haematomicrobium sanguinis TaxID=479106 RepID=UPI00068A579F|nr:response regulator transcription factor [Haematomicrobium sanguinis]
MSDRINIAIVDDDELTKVALSAMLATFGGFRVVGTSDGKCFSKFLESLPNVDVFILDINLGGKTCQCVIPEIRSAHNQVPIVLMTSFDPVASLAGLTQGEFMGMFSKSSPAESIAQVLRESAIGRHAACPNVAKLLFEAVTGVTDSASASRDTPSLTARETEVLNLLASGLDNRALAKKLNISVGTIKAHVASILAKTGLRSRSELIVWVYQQHNAL